MPRASGEFVGPWKLVKFIASGGSAHVWRAQKPDGVHRAVKVLKTLDGSDSQYKRFRDEISIQRRIADRPGILPLVDACLPETPSYASPAWLAMPIATVLPHALGADPSLERVIAAFAVIAATLSGLAADGIFHRDIKPTNLYFLNEEWLVGDFGLAEFPDKEALTHPGRKLGPMFYIAPEMLAHADTAGAGPADVYSFAKALWVMATGQQYPVPGEQRIDVPSLTLSAYVDNNRAKLLDGLIDRATRYTPTDRPTMAEFARELAAWISKKESQQIPSMASAVARLAPAVARRDREDSRRQRKNEAVNSILDVYARHLRDIGAQVKAACGIDPGFINEPEARASTFWPTVSPHKCRFLGSRLILTMQNPTSTNERRAITLLGSLALFDYDGKDEIALCSALNIHRADIDRSLVVFSYGNTAIHSTPSAEVLLATVISQFSEHWPEALSKFAEVIENPEIVPRNLA